MSIILIRIRIMFMFVPPIGHKPFFWNRDVVGTRLHAGIIIILKFRRRYALREKRPYDINICLNVLHRMLLQGMKGLLSFFSAPLLGSLSDLQGRKYFLLMTVTCTCLPIPFLLLRYVIIYIYIYICVCMCVCIYIYIYIYIYIIIIIIMYIHVIIIILTNLEFV